MAYKITSKFVVAFLGNVNHKEVHEVARETRDCQITEILSAGHAVGFSPDSLAQAHKEGYDNCAYCIGGSTR